MYLKRRTTHITIRSSGKPDSPLTSLAQPLDEIGKKSVEILLDQINNNVEPRMYELESRVIARESTIRFVSAPQ